MKRSGHLKHYTPLKARKPWQPERKPLKRTPLKKKSTSPTAQIKGNIQALLREIVIIRDGCCILRDLPARIRYFYEVPDCNGYRKDGELILQADHLITRENNATYADSRLVVCVCQGHHGWKSIAGNMRKPQYDAIVRVLLPPSRRSVACNLSRFCFTSP
jgi:hypothetical protein